MVLLDGEVVVYREGATTVTNFRLLQESDESVRAIPLHAIDFVGAIYRSDEWKLWAAVILAILAVLEFLTGQSVTAPREVANVAVVLGILSVIGFIAWMMSRQTRVVAMAGSGRVTLGKTGKGLRDYDRLIAEICGANQRLREKLVSAASA